MSTDFKDNPKAKGKFGIGLMLLAVVFLISVFLPWTKISATFTQSRIQGTIDLIVNGLGRGDFLTDLFVETDMGSQTLEEHYNVFLPPYLIFSTPLIIVAGINLVTGYQLSSDLPNLPDSLSLPTMIGDPLEKHWPQLLLLNSIVALASTVSFGWIYFTIPSIGVTPSTPLSVNALLNNLMYFSLKLKGLTAASKLISSLAVGPGIGYLVATAASIALAYMYYVYYQYKRNWPKLWKIRGFLVLFLIFLPFFPWMTIVSPDQVKLLVGLFVPLGGRPIGGLVYLGVSLALLTLIKLSADTSNVLDEFVKESYTRTDFTDEEIQELMDKVEAQRRKLGILRFGQIPIALALLVLGFFLLQNLMSLNIAFQASIPAGGVLSASGAYWPGWAVWMIPIGLLIVMAIFRH